MISVWRCQCAWTNRLKCMDVWLCHRSHQIEWVALCTMWCVRCCVLWCGLTSAARWGNVSNQQGGRAGGEQPPGQASRSFLGKPEGECCGKCVFWRPTKLQSHECSLCPSTAAVGPSTCPKKGPDRVPQNLPQKALTSLPQIPLPTAPTRASSKSRSLRVGGLVAELGAGVWGGGV